MTVLRGFATIDYSTDDQAAASRWYADLLAVIDNPHYVEVLAARE